MKSKILFVAAVAALAAAPIASAIELHPQTLQAWEQYVRGADQRMLARAAGATPFLWIDESERRAARVHAGEVAIEPAGAHATHPVPDGLIHDWIGAVYIPGATLDSLEQVVHSYGRYKEFYKPVVADSKTISTSESGQDFSMVWVRHVLFVNAAMTGCYHATDVMVDAHRGYSIVDSTEIREIENYGADSQRTLAPDTGSGFIWRMHTIARFVERDGGVYLELEAMALTRDIPGGMRWLVSPVVNHLSINSLMATLKQTREAVDALPAVTAALAMPRKRGE